METFQMSRPGADSDQLTQTDEEVLERITQRMRRKLIEQRILSKPSFQDFDKWVENASFSKEKLKYNSDIIYFGNGENIHCHNPSLIGYLTVIA